MLPPVPDLAGKKKNRHGKKWPYTLLASRPGGSGKGGAPTAAEERHHFRTTAGYTYVLVCICILLVSECARLEESLLPCRLSGWRAGRGGVGKEGPALLFLSSPLAARVDSEAWLEGLLLRLALAGPAGYLKNALLRRRLGCYVAANA